MNNKSKLIPRKQIGGLIPKFQSSGKVYKKYQKQFRYKGDSPETAIQLPELIVTPQKRNVPYKKGATKSAGKPRITVISKTTTPVSITTPVPTSGNYTIQRGDTLSKLARQHHTTVEELAKLNNISNVNRIYTGQNLILPGQLTGEIVEAKPLTETFSNPTINKLPTPYEYWYNQGGRQAYENDLINNAFKTYDGSSLNDFTHVRDLETNQPKSQPNLNLQLDIPNMLQLNPKLENRYRAYSKRFTFARKGTKLIPRNNGFK